MKKLFVWGALALSLTVAHAAETYQDAVDKARAAAKAGQVFEDEKFSREALDLAKTADEKFAALAHLATLEQDKEQWPKARQWWAQIAALEDLTDEQKATAQFGIGSNYLNEDNFGQGRAVLQGFLQMKDAPPSFQEMARFGIAASYGNEKQWPQAVATYEQIVADPDVSVSTRVGAQLAIGNAYTAQEKWDEAVAAFRAAGAIEGLSPLIQAQIQKGINSVHARQGHPERVAAQSSALTSGFIAKMREIVGKDQVSDKNPEELAQIRDYLEATLLLVDADKSVGGINLLSNLGETYLALKEYDKSREAFGKVLSSAAPRDATGEKLTQYQMFRREAQVNIASAYQSQGDIERARQEFAKVLEMPNLNPKIEALTKWQLQQLK